MYGRGGRGLRGPVGVGWRACDMTHYEPSTRPPRCVGSGLQGVRTLCTVLRTLSDLGGGVNGHRVNLRDECGVCDDVTG